MRVNRSLWATVELLRFKNNKDISCYLEILAEVSAPMPSDADLAQKNADSEMKPPHKNVCQIDLVLDLFRDGNL